MSATHLPLATPASTHPPDAHRGASFHARLGMWVFLGSEVLFFSGLFLAYALARAGHPQAFAAASRHTEIVIGTANTVLLLCSSAVMAWAAETAADLPWRHTRLALGLTLLLGLAFMGLKGIEYTLDWRDGLFPGPGFHLGSDGGGSRGAVLFFVLYYVLTVIHALHLCIGLGVLTWLLATCVQASLSDRAARIEVSALYWHFVDVIWILLYPLIYLVDRSTGS